MQHIYMNIHIHMSNDLASTVALDSRQSTGKLIFWLWGGKVISYHIIARCSLKSSLCCFLRLKYNVYLCTFISGADHYLIHWLSEPDLLLVLCLPGRERRSRQQRHHRVWKLCRCPVVGSGRNLCVCVCVCVCSVYLSVCVFCVLLMMVVKGFKSWRSALFTTLRARSPFLHEVRLVLVTIFHTWQSLRD